MPKLSILFFLLELYSHLGQYSNYSFSLIELELLENINGSENIILKNLLLISSLLSLIIGTVVGLAQTKIKRLLAYSTISHLGFILLALAINTEQSIDSFIFYVFQYTLTNLNTFLIILGLGYIINNSVLFMKDKDITLITQLKGQFSLRRKSFIII